MGGTGSGISWTICKSFAPYSRQITMPAPHHSTDRPTNTVKTGKALTPVRQHHLLWLLILGALGKHLLTYWTSSFLDLPTDSSGRDVAPFTLRLGVITAPTSLNGGQSNSARCSVVFLGWYTIYTLAELLPPNEILTGAKFTLRPNLAFSYTGSVTAQHLNSGFKLCGVQQRAPPIFGRAAITLRVLLLHQYFCYVWLCFYIVLYCVFVHCVTEKSSFLSFCDNKLHLTNYHTIQWYYTIVSTQFKVRMTYLWCLWLIIIQKLVSLLRHKVH